MRAVGADRFHPDGDLSRHIVGGDRKNLDLSIKRHAVGRGIAGPNRRGRRQRLRLDFSWLLRAREVQTENAVVRHPLPFVLPGLLVSNTRDNLRVWGR
jgi:hypothetical protein